ncbi:zwei Ig domain protein zig-8-like [Planococcus citri]|uniref:zwei Ig domain protein zig-8-like n=1 Tax=Planococcus citri TaxID=170843 RepID=UPI0031F84759
MFIISCSLLALLPVALLVVLEAENGTTPYEASLLGNVTINLAENEIDNSHETETENAVVDDVRSMITETSRPGITLAQPPPRSPNNKASAWGPFFEDGAEPQNVTAKLGTTVLLDCKIGLLYDKTVSWVRRKGDIMHILTVGRTTYSADQRIELNFRYPNNWRLQITSVTRRDDGLYECQIATHPTTVKKIFLKVLAPEVQILDEKGRPVSERYYKAGSMVRVSCVAKQAEGNPADSIVWSTRGKLLSTGITTNSNSSPGEIVSHMKISKAQKHHSGLYTCTVDQLASASVTIHILNGELPAAIHGGCSNTMVSCLITICLLTLCSLMVTNYHMPRR